MPHESAGDVIDRQWEDRQKQYDEVRLKLRKGWRNDEATLLQYFNACIQNWKSYKGPRTHEQLNRLYGIYKQATVGDCDEPEPENPKGHIGIKWAEWHRLRGMSTTMAKRRFITFLASIDPAIIDVMPSEKPPDGFPTDHSGHKICAKCNTTVGCNRPLLDNHGIDLRQQLFEDEELQQGEKLRAWVANALKCQKCIWGVHKPISKAETKPFQKWFDLPENRGFRAYDSSQVMLILKDLLKFHYEVAYDMQCNKSEYSRNDFNKQSQKVIDLSDAYSSLAGDEFIFMVPCTSTSEMCNERRLADAGKNHAHPVKIDPPVQAESSTHRDAVELRLQCVALNLNSHIGIEPNVEKRCEIYRARIAEHFLALGRAKEARVRMDARAEVHAKEKKQVKELAGAMNRRQLADACHANKVDHLVEIIIRGGDPNVESLRGATPLLCMVRNNAPSEQLEEVIRKGADVNYVNEFGFTPLMLACRMREPKMLHILVRNGCTITLDTKKRGKGRTAMHWCAIHSFEEGAQILLDYVKENGGDSLRTTRLLDAIDRNGQSPLMLAAKKRNGLFCKTLTKLGANPNLRDEKGHTAAYIARNAGWVELADWLEKKVGGGLANLETYSDLQYDKKVRYGSMKTKEFINEFCENYLSLIGGRGNSSPLGPPSIARQRIEDWGEREGKDQQKFIDRQYSIFGDVDRDTTYSEEPEPVRAAIDTLKAKLADMLNLIQQGYTDPNTEALSKPLPWTPLMCAVAMNDLRTVKLLIREGGDPNHPNKDGMTALMLSAQLQNLDIMIELLMLGGNVRSVDSEGFSVLAYAGSLPVVSGYKQNVVNYMLEGDSHGKSKFTATEILKTGLKYGVGDLKDELAVNRQETSDEEIDAHFSFLKLLEQNGLTRMESRRELLSQAQGTFWRIEQLEEWRKEYIQETYSETSSEQRDRADRERFLALKQAEIDAKIAEDRGGLRCPLCTLLVPCSHFFRLESLKKFLQREEKKAKQLESAYGTKQTVSSLGKAMVDKNAIVLMETELHNRQTDRSVEIFHKFHDRERTVTKEMAIINARRKKNQIAKAEGVFKLWLEEVDDMGNKHIVNQETGESWSHHFDEASQKEFYHNDKTGQSSWESPASTEEKESKDIPQLSTEAVVVVVEDGALKSAIKKDKKKKNRRVGFILPDGEVYQHPDAVAPEAAVTVSTVSNAINASDLSLVSVVTPVEEYDSDAENPMPSSKKATALSVGENPVPISGRSAFMFLSDFFKRPNEGLRGVKNRQVSPNEPSKVGDVPPIQVSGWLFVSLSYVMDVVPPIEKLRLSLETWGDIIEHVNRKFIEEWAPNILLEPLADSRTWKIPKDKRCVVCGVGYCRFRDEPASPLMKLCLPCTIRKEIYDKAKLTLPRSFRKETDKTIWPFKAIQSNDLPLIMYTHTQTRITSAGSPVKSAKLEKIDEIEASLDEGVIVTYTEDGSVASREVVSSANSANSSKTEGVGLDDDERSTASGTSLFSFEKDSLVSLSSNPGTDVDKYGVRELQLLPYLISKGHFGEVERTLRIAINSSRVNEGEDVTTLVAMLELQSEMYKAMGIWPLVVALIMDCVDLTATIVGYDDQVCTGYVFKTTELLRSMKCSVYAKRYLAGLVKNLGVVAHGEEKRVLASKLVDDERDRIANFDSTYNSVINSIKRTVPVRKLPRRAFSVYGIGALWTTLTSSSGYAASARLAFADYCENVSTAKKDSSYSDYFAFIVAIIRIKNVTNINSAFYRHLIHQLVQQQLSKKLIKKSVIAKASHELLSSPDRQFIEHYLKFGEHFSLSVFDPLIDLSLRMLKKPFQRFLFTDPSKLVLDKMLKSSAEAYDIVATVIQTAFRCHRARAIVNPLIAVVRAEAAKFQAESDARELRAAKALMVKYGSGGGHQKK